MTKILTKENFKNMIEAAKNANACNYDIEIIKSLSFEEFLEHEDAPYWLYWYARRVLKGRFKEAEHIIAKDFYYAHKYIKLRMVMEASSGDIICPRDVFEKYISFISKNQESELKPLFSSNPIKR